MAPVSLFAEENRKEEEEAPPPADDDEEVRGAPVLPCANSRSDTTELCS